MAWVRTATSLISFGFTIYKGFQYLQQSQGARHGLSPRDFALAMIGLGIGSLTLATFQHRRDLQVLEAQYGKMPQLDRADRRDGRRSTRDPGARARRPAR
jgi:putative membrane protein